jgi:nucleoside-diphosphate-sugar epimerase
MPSPPPAPPGTALVTGGAGFIGSHLVDRLVSVGWSVRVLDDFSTGRERNLERSREEVELIRGDVSQEGVLEEALRGVDLVFHQAAMPSVPQTIREPRRSHAVNLSATLALLEAARRSGVRRVVFAASCAAYGDDPSLPKREESPVRPLSPYALQKLAAERYCWLYSELYGLETVALRYFNVYGPRQDPASDYAAVVPRFLAAALQGRSVCVHGDGEQTRDFVFVGDVVEANLCAAAAPPRVSGCVVNVASGRQTSVDELRRAVGECVGCELEALHEAAREGDVRRSWADVSRARELLGWVPATDLAQGLRNTVDALKRDAEGEQRST